MKNPADSLVSVIIPAYNVEKYIEKCVSTVLEQDYPNIEIIIVDDGSSDQTGIIIDNLAKQYQKMVVLHKENGGVSSARNEGLSWAKGKYIVFIDGDDYIAPDCISYLVNLANINNSDFCLSTNCFSKLNESQVRKDNIRCMNNAQATALLLSPKVFVGCWNKIYKTDFLMENNIRFRSDFFYGEGLQFITAVSQRANHITVGDRKVYFYRKDNQNSATSFFKPENIFNGEKSIDMIESKMILQDNTVSNMLLLHRCMFYVGALVRFRAYNLQMNYEESYRRWLKYIRSHCFRIIRCNDITLYRKALIACCCISPWIVCRMDIIRRNRIKNKSVPG